MATVSAGAYDAPTVIALAMPAPQQRSVTRPCRDSMAKRAPMKQCTKCLQWKDESEFSKRTASPDGLYPQCKACVKAGNKERKERAEKMAILEAAKGADARKDFMLMKHYGITLDDYNRMCEEQNYCCAICGRSQQDFQRALAVDHDHTSGLVRGLLCPDCNRGLGGFLDNEDIVRKALQYLEHHNARHS